MVTDRGAPVKRLISAVAVLGLAACAAPPTRYSWGNYEQLVYAAYLAPADVPAEKQVEIMEQDYQAARAANRRVPPGWHAHLGYLYYELGRIDDARRELLTEKAEFPESAVFVDRLIANLKRP